MENPIWHALPSEVRRRIDEHLRLGRHVPAVKEVLDAAPGLSLRVSLHDGMGLMQERWEALGSPVAPARRREPAELLAEIAGLPSRPEAIEAVWDGDTTGWFVLLLAVTAEPDGDHELAVFRSGGDLRLFDGTAPPWPEAAEASALGRAVAGELGIPFHFGSPETPGYGAPRWRDGR